MDSEQAAPVRSAGNEEMQQSQRRGASHFAHSRAIIIGIDRYQQIRPLNTAVNDAQRLAESLRTQHGYDDVLMLQDATYATLATELGESLAARAGRDDRLLLYFAGHGIALDGDDGPEGFLIPADANAEERTTFLAMADLYRWLEALPCRHLLVILDCCFAGAFTWYGRRHLAPIGAKLYREHYDRFVREPAWQILTSAAHDQEALDVLGGKPIGARGEHIAGGARHSPFADALFAALQGEGDLIPKGQGDGVVTATELYLYLRQTVEVSAEAQARHRQTPELWPFSRSRHGKGEFIFLVPGHGEVVLAPAPELTAAKNPYRGLQSYDEAHAPLFFGRRTLIEKLASAVDEFPLTVVLGASGTGKSSVVKAGVVPYLKQNRAEGARKDAKAQSKEFPAYKTLPPMRPGDAPLSVLAELVAANLPGSSQQPGRSDPATFVATAIDAWLLAHPQQRLLLIVDQVEELVTLCRDDVARTAFLQTLADLLAAHGEHLRVIFTLRTDFEPQFQRAPLFAPPLAAHVARVFVPPLNQAELREVIEEPAAISVLFFDPPQLVDTLIEEVIQTPGALPLLSFTLEQLYLNYIDRQSQAQRAGITLERSLTAADYAALGGVIGSLRRRADAIYAELPDDAHRATMQRVMLRMVAVEGGELARRRVVRAELNYPLAAENSAVQTVLERLVAARLLVTGSMDLDSDGGDDAFVEPAHDALVAAWDKLLLWRRDAEAVLPLSLHRDLTRAALRWEQAPSNDKQQYLWNSEPRLPVAETVLWRATQAAQPNVVHWLRQLLAPQSDLPNTTTALNAVESAFVQQSVRRRAFVMRRLVGATLGVMAVVAVLVFASLLFQQSAQQERTAKETEQGLRAEVERLSRVIRADQLAAYAQNVINQAPHLSILLALEAITTTQSHGEARTAAAEQALRDALARPIGFALGGHKSTRNPIAWRPQGTYLAAIADDSTVQVWDLAAPEPVIAARLVHQHPVDQIVWSPTGQLLAAFGDDRISIWELNAAGAPADPITLEHPGVFAVEWAQDGRRLMSKGAERLRAWEITASQTATALIDLPTSRWTDRIAWNPAGEWLAVGEPTGAIAVWNLSARNPNANPLRLNHPGLSAIAWAPDGTRLMSAGETQLRLWNLASEAGYANPIDLPYPASIWSTIDMLAWSPDGKWLVTGIASGSDSVWLWDLSAPELGPSVGPVALSYPGWALHEIDFSPDGGRLALFSGNPMLLLAVATAWDLSAANPTAVTLRNGDGSGERALNSIDWAPDGMRLAGGSPDGTLRVWNLARENPAAEVLVLYKENTVAAAQWSSDGIWLAGSGENVLRAWDVAADNPIADPIAIDVAADSSFGAVTVEWTPAGDRLAVMRDDSLTAWDLPARQPLGAPLLHQATIAQIPERAQWAPAGTQLASSYDQEIRIWNLHLAGSGPPALVLRHTSQIQEMAWAPDGSQLAATGADGTILGWQLADGAPAFVLDITHDERNREGAALHEIDWAPVGMHLSGVAGNSVWIWDLAANDPATTTLVLDHQSRILDTAWAPDGSRLAAIGADGVIQIWGLPASAPAATPITLRQEASTYAFPDVSPQQDFLLAWSPDGQWLAARAVNLLQVWDLSMRDPAANTMIFPHEAPVTAWAWHPQRPLLAAASGHLLTEGRPQTDSRIQIWPVAHTALAATPVVLIDAEPTHHFAIAWTDDGERLAGWDPFTGVIRLWRMDEAELTGVSCRTAGRNLSQAEWGRYFQGEPYRLTCPRWPGQ